MILFLQNNQSNPHIWKNRNTAYYLFKNNDWHLHIPRSLHKLSYLSLTTTLEGIIIFIPRFIDEENQAQRDFVLRNLACEQRCEGVPGVAP